ncbi:MAG TPA: SH3 domain-containing protein [Roseiflexaceae bacterium]|nr:SH3 domain-containing protein [Roseiflexaceae bacterium]HMP42078.1 SH3 domain-containing protein [Roseiflexaceae bacterium]
MPSVLQSPLVLGLLLLAVLVVVILLIQVRRRRRPAGDEATPVPDVSVTPIDYTSMPVEETLSPLEQLQRASPAVKVLIVLLPLVLIGVIAVISLSLQAPVSTAPAPTPIPPGSLTIVRAEVAGTGTIAVEGESQYLAPGAAVTAVLSDGDQEFLWYNKEDAIGRPDSRTGRVLITLNRIEGAPVPQRDRAYQVVLISTQIDGGVVRSQPETIVVLGPFESDFYQATAAAPTITPTSSPPLEPTAVATLPTPTATLEVIAPGTTPITGTVRANGNIRQAPSLQGEVLGQVSEGEIVILLASSADGDWYRLEAAEATGWVSSTLLDVEEELTALLPVETPQTGPTASVFNGGNVRTQPNLNGLVIDQINAGETVILLARNADGTWFQIVNQRQITGWVSATLLTIAADVRRDVPISTEAVSTPLPATQTALPLVPTAEAAPAATPAPATGLTATVFNGGNVRASPNLAGDVLDQVNARETVELLARTADGNWYQITNIRNVTGWVNRTLLTVDPEVARRVPVAE